MERDLEGRVALVTGGSGGIGFAAAEALARRGTAVAIASRNPERLAGARERLLQAGAAKVASISADVGRLDDLERAVAEARSALGPIDILVANGGGPPAKAAIELTEDDWAQAWGKVFLFVPRLCRLVLPDMREHRFGRIIAVGSVSAKQPIANLALSNALRPAVVGYLKTLSNEVGRDGVTVNAVLPGYTSTERQVELSNAAAQRTGKSPESIVKGWVESTALGRMAEPREIGEVIAFLASPAAAFVTGQALPVDGGYVKGL
jgi:3-oxoacyl-[acyl-carrier protein] reductase